MHFKDVRSPEDLKSFTEDYNRLRQVTKDRILDEMLDYLRQYELFDQEQLANTKAELIKALASEEGRYVKGRRKRRTRLN